MLDDHSQTILGDFQPGFPGLESHHQHRQPFCGDIEGWGPISPFRFDLTPCFLDLTVSLVAAWGLFMGAGAIWFLLNKRWPQPVAKNWHFYAKLVSSFYAFLSFMLSVDMLFFKRTRADYTRSYYLL